MIVTTAPAPPNPISAVTFTGFSFAPRQKFYNVFKYGTLAKLSVGARSYPSSVCLSVIRVI